MNTSGSSRAVSPVVGVILVVAITVALSGVVGVFVFDLGQYVSDSNAQSDIATRTTFNDDGTASIQVVTGEADELRVLVNGTEANSTSNPTPGTSLSVSATPNSSVTIISETNGQSTVVSSSGNAAPETSVSTPTDGLIAHWNMDGDATDAVGSNDGTVNGVSFPPDTTRDSIARFDGTDDTIAVTSSGLDTIGSDAFTVSMWVYPHTTSGERVFLTKTTDNDATSDPFKMGIWYDSAEVWWGMDDATGWQNLRGQSLTANNWYHIVFIYDGTTTRSIYVNSTLDVTDSVTDVDYRTTYDTTLGNRYNNDGGFSPSWYDGGIDDVRIYDRALNDSEVQDLYNATK